MQLSNSSIYNGRFRSRADLMLILIGTYTRNTDSVGVYAFKSDSDGHFESCAVNPAIDNPSWLVRHPYLEVVYAVNEVSDMADGGAVSAFACDASGRLTLLNQKFSLGADPCHLAIDSAGSTLYVSNYSGGNFTGFPLAPDGRLQDFTSLVQHGGKGVDPVRQSGPHVHSMTLDTTGQNAYVCDLGLDQVVKYPLLDEGRVMVDGRATTRLRPGAGPRLLEFDSKSHYGYAVNELDNTIITFERDPSGHLIELSTCSSLPEDFVDKSYCAHIAVTADNRFVYVSNRGHDSIAVFRIEDGGALALVQRQSTLGKHPRHFALSPDEHYVLVANRDSNNVAVFERDPESGQLAATGQEMSVPAPVCVLFLA